jgi:hypothetical protein
MLFHRINIINMPTLRRGEGVPPAAAAPLAV